VHAVKKGPFRVFDRSEYVVSLSPKYWALTGFYTLIEYQPGITWYIYSNDILLQDQYNHYFKAMPDFTHLHNAKNAGSSSEENETSANCLAFQGTHRIHEPNGGLCEVTGNGHHGQDFVGAASIRAGKGIKLPPSGAMSMMNVV
jgi:hypothetical protein